MTRALGRLLLCVSLCGCQGALTTTDAPADAPAPSAEGAAPPEVGGTDSTEAPEPASDDPLASLDAQTVRDYLAKLAPMIVRRTLSSDELARIEAVGGDAIPELLDTWANEDTLGEAARQLVSERLATGGTRDGIDFDLPGHLAAHLARNDRPWSEVLTSDTCYDAEGTAIACDTGAPYTAGVLTTRAYLVSRVGRFNLTRASTMMHVFVCRGYPSELQPQVERTSLLPLFQARTAEEQTDERAIGGFGNGAGCYTCHGQFAPHAQLFVKFDSDGTWASDASGVQDPEGELGRSYGGLMASHYLDPGQAASERSDVFGVPVDDLSDAAQVITAMEEFWPCQVRNIIAFGLGLETTFDIDSSILADIVAAARELAPSPSFGDLVVATFSNPTVVRGVVDSLNGGTP